VAGWKEKRFYGLLTAIKIKKINLMLNLMFKDEMLPYLSDSRQQY
jgi:hypothetical protein